MTNRLSPGLARNILHNLCVTPATLHLDHLDAALALTTDARLRRVLSEAIIALLRGRRGAASVGRAARQINKLVSSL